MRLYVNVKIISHSVGQGLAPAEVISEYITTNGCYQN